MGLIAAVLYKDVALGTDSGGFFIFLGLATIFLVRASHSWNNRAELPVDLVGSAGRFRSLVLKAAARTARRPGAASDSPFRPDPPVRGGWTSLASARTE
jgi:hypothetical protein